MDKNAIKKYAIWARRELIARVSQKALQYGIEEKETVDATADSIYGKLLSADEKKQRQALIAQINEKGYEQVMEEVAYTWFNRFSALRFMEVNNYLPSHVRVFTDEDNNFKPQIITEAIHLDFDGLDTEKVYAYKDADQTDELYKYLLIVQCNALNKILPGMFQRISDYTELLLPDNLLREGSVIEQMITCIEEDDWKDAVQIIGWLYQFYNAEKKDDVFEALKKNVKISKENIPAATQLFTPDWIVRYMVENSLGRFWLDGHPDDELKSRWAYYLENTEAENASEENNALPEYKNLIPEEIKVIDPCCGSGHILVYMFDLLMQIYESYGYSTREAVESILEKNLYGLDIDERATQLAYFSVMMKARQYDRRFFNRGIQPHISSTIESNNINQFALDYFCNDNTRLRTAMNTIITEMKDAKEYGSILRVSVQNWDELYSRFNEVFEDISFSRDIVLTELYPLVKCAEILSIKYHAVITNPPYMGGGGMLPKLSEYLSTNYPIGKTDLFSAFMLRAGEMCHPYGRMGFLTPYVWMFIASYADLREYLVRNKFIETMTQLEYNAFPEACVPVCAFTLLNKPSTKKGEFIKLSEFKGAAIQEPKTLEAISNPQCGYRYSISPMEFLKIPGTSIAYWLKSSAINVFELGTPLAENAAVITKGIFTGDNNRFLRLWFEVAYNEINSEKWNLYCKGGAFRRWYGNTDYVVLWENNEGALANYPKSGLGASKYFGKQSFVWSKITNSLMSFRYNPQNVYFDDASPAVIFNTEFDYYLLGLMNSKAIQYYLDLLSPTMNNQIGDIKKVPVLDSEEFREEVENLVKQNIEISKLDYDSSEMSYAFSRFPLIINGVEKISDAMECYKSVVQERRITLKKNEERINEIFNELYGLSETITNGVSDEYVSLYEYNESDMIKRFISYAVGCMFGRYSLNIPGVVCTSNRLDPDNYVKFKPDVDNIIPLSDDEYFEDDIVSKFIKFVSVVYGENYLEENLEYIAGHLSSVGATARLKIRNYFNVEFFKDHCDMYTSRGAGKRPIYWQFDSGKKGGFKCLMYIHRYQSDTVARIRTDYVHELQSRYRNVISDIESRLHTSGSSEKVKLAKKLEVLKAQENEVRIYEEKIHHFADKMLSLNIDDGIKANYEIFKDILAKIK